MSYTQILYHIILRTKYSDKALALDKAPELYKYMWGIIKNKNGVLYRINGMEDHIHILCDLHPLVPLADLIKALKGSSSRWIRETGIFPKFRGWGARYCALTYSYKEKDIIINYIKNQQKHHRSESFQEEIQRLWKEQNIEKNKGSWVEKPAPTYPP